jgi:hypothetical protein
MSREFEGILPVIVSGLAQKIADKQHIGEKTVLESLYASKLYALLEREETGVWQYSVSFLYEKYREEANTGELAFPS